LRAVLRTSLIDDPENVAFLSCWAYEEYFHGRAIREFLKASGVDVETDRYVKVKHDATFRESLEEFGASLLGRFSRHFHAAYLTWGAVQELTTLEGYGVLACRENFQSATQDRSCPDYQRRAPALFLLLQQSPPEFDREPRAVAHDIPVEKVLD